MTRVLINNYTHVYTLWRIYFVQSWIFNLILYIYLALGRISAVVKDRKQ